MFNINEVDDNTIFAVVASLFTGIIILLVTKFAEYLSERKERKKTRILVHYNLLKFLKVLHRQSRYFDHFKNQMDIDYKEGYGYKYTITTSLIVLYGLGYEKIYSAFFKGFENYHLNRKEKLQAFNNIWNTIEYANLTFPIALKKADNFLLEMRELNENRNIAISKAQLIIEEFRIKFHRQLGSNEQLGEYYSFIEELINSTVILKEYYKYPTLINEYLQKIIQENRKNPELMRQYYTDINPTELNHYISESQMRYDELKNLFTARNSHYSEVSEQYLKHYFKLKKDFYILRSPSTLVLKFLKLFGRYKTKKN